MSSDICGIEMKKGKFHIERKVHNSFLGQTSACDTAPFVASPTLVQPAVSPGQIVSNSEVSQVFAISLPVRISIGALPARLPRTKRRWLCTYARVRLFWNSGWETGFGPYH